MEIKGAGWRITMAIRGQISASIGFDQIRRGSFNRADRAASHDLHLRLDSLLLHAHPVNRACRRTLANRQTRTNGTTYS
jgi:hypothetical protein